MKFGEAFEKGTGKSYLVEELEEILKSGNIKIKAVHDKNSSSIEESSVSIVTDNNINDISNDLHSYKDNIITTEYEDKFTSKGIKINYFDASKN